MNDDVSQAQSRKGGSAMISTVLLGNVKGYLRTRTAVRGLLRFSDRELEDMRLTRTELAAIARRYFCR